MVEAHAGLDIYPQAAARGTLPGHRADSDDLSPLVMSSDANRRGMNGSAPVPNKHTHTHTS